MRFCLLLCCLLFGNILLAQTAPNFFKPVEEAAITLPEKAERKLIPLKYQTYRLDYAGIKNVLQKAPQEYTEAARQHSCTVSIPLANGTFEDFAVWEIAMLEPALAAEVPFIRTFAGESLLDKRKTVRLSYTLKGFQAMIFNPDQSVEYLDRYADWQTEYYMAYDRKDISPADRLQLPTAWEPDAATLAVDQTPTVDQQPVVQARDPQADPVKLRVYKYIVSTTGEYGLDNGTTRDEVFSAVTEHTNRVSAILERDIDIRLQLVQASLIVTFINPGVSPFTGSTVQDWMGQNPGVLESLNVPTTAYDLGHVYARYISGGAIGVAGGLSCASSKARGCSGGTGAYGDGFINVIGQEIGHQMGGGHTWNRCGGGNGRAGLTAFEPGSGSTIMSYAGACGSDNVQGYSDLYYHTGSIDEIHTYVFVGSNCGSLVTTTNNPPVVKLDYQDNFFIPWGTPFELQGSATDPDGDPLVYNWEEIDLGPEVPLAEPQASSPIFRTWPAVTETNRYFPKLSTVLNNSFDITEQMPGPWTRDLTFRLTARDNRTGGGGVAWADVAFKAWGDAGPFLVLTPNTASNVWHVGEYTEVRWDVANTNKAPVSCSHVNIRLSTDGGQTYPITLAEHVNNDGSHFVLVPNLNAPLSRVRIDAENSVFFDVSDKNFKIQQATQPSFTMGLNNDSGILCLPAEQKVEIQTAGVLGYSEPVELAIASALPANVSATFSATTIQPGESATLTLDFSKVTEENTFTITLQATSGNGAPILRDIVLTTLRNDFSSLALNLPANGATELQLTQTLHWTKALDAITYDVQFANSPSFEPGSILASTTGTTLDSFKLPVFLAKGQPYFWRVRPVNECGAADWTEPFFFSTFAEQCTQWEATDLPKNITANGTPTIESKIIVNSGGLIKNMEIRQLKGYHEFFKDLDVHLISPQGTDVTLWTAKCGNFNGFFNLRLTDEAPSNFLCPPPNNGLAYKPQNPLSNFYNQNSTGTWTLRIRDTELGGGGGFDIFKLEFCSELIVNPPYLVNNNVLVVDPGNNKTITPDLLLVEDLDNTHSELLYTLLTVPEEGHLALNWGNPLVPGDQFTQSDLDNGSIRFFDYGGTYTTDGFRFMVTDGAGGYFGTPKFLIQNMVVGTDEPTAAAFDFRLFPNPANDAVWVATDQPGRDAVRVSLINTAGQQIQSTMLAAGSDRVRLNTGGLPRGLYFVQIQGVVRKLVLR